MIKGFREPCSHSDVSNLPRQLAKVVLRLFYEQDIVAFRSMAFYSLLLVDVILRLAMPNKVTSRIETDSIAVNARRALTMDAFFANIPTYT